MFLPDLAMRRGDWKLLCDYDGGNRQLFDLQNDPGEMENLAAVDPGRAAALATELVAWHESLPADNGPALGRQALQAAGPRSRGVQ
jgi:arylsulfatase A-like enzyme